MIKKKAIILLFNQLVTQSEQTKTVHLTKCGLLHILSNRTLDTKSKKVKALSNDRKYLPTRMIHIKFSRSGSLNFIILNYVLNKSSINLQIVPTNPKKEHVLQILFLLIDPPHLTANTSAGWGCHSHSSVLTVDIVSLLL